MVVHICAMFINIVNNYSYNKTLYVCVPHPHSALFFWGQWSVISKGSVTGANRLGCWNFVFINPP